MNHARALLCLALAWFALACSPGCSDKRTATHIPAPDVRPRFVISIHSVDGKSQRMEFGETFRHGVISSFDRESSETRSMPANWVLDYLIRCGEKYKRE